MSYAQAAVDAHKAARQHWKVRDTNARLAYTVATGLVLPETVGFTDENGDRYAINLDVRLVLIERGAPTEDEE